jgi:hypothetical protein
MTVDDPLVVTIPVTTLVFLLGLLCTVVVMVRSCRRSLRGAASCMREGYDRTVPEHEYRRVVTVSSNVGSVMGSRLN